MLPRSAAIQYWIVVYVSCMDHHHASAAARGSAVPSPLSLFNEIKKVYFLFGLCHINPFRLPSRAIQSHYVVLAVPISKHCAAPTRLVWHANAIGEVAIIVWPVLRGVPLTEKHRPVALVMLFFSPRLHLTARVSSFLYFILGASRLLQNVRPFSRCQPTC